MPPPLTINSRRYSGNHARLRPCPDSWKWLVCFGLMVFSLGLGSWVVRVDRFCVVIKHCCYYVHQSVSLVWSPLIINYSRRYSGNHARLRPCPDSCKWLVCFGLMVFSLALGSWVVRVDRFCVVTKHCCYLMFINQSPWYGPP